MDAPVGPDEHGYLSWEKRKVCEKEREKERMSVRTLMSVFSGKIQSVSFILY